MGRPVLFIAHHFPPMGGAGVYRSLRFVQNLPDHGFDPIVLTIPENEVINTGYPYDQDLLDQVPESVEIHRVATQEPVRFKRALMKVRIYRLAWFFLFPYLWESSALWPGNAMSKALELIDRYKIDLIYTSSGPYSSLNLGHQLQQKAGVKWVADLRDPYTDGYAWKWPSKFHWKASRNWENKILRRPNHLIVNTEEVRKLYLKRGLRNGDDISVITNGY